MLLFLRPALENSVTFHTEHFISDLSRGSRLSLRPFSCSKKLWQPRNRNRQCLGVSPARLGRSNNAPSVQVHYNKHSVSTSRCGPPEARNAYSRGFRYPCVVHGGAHTQINPLFSFSSTDGVVVAGLSCRFSEKGVGRSRTSLSISKPGKHHVQS